MAYILFGGLSPQLRMPLSDSEEYREGKIEKRAKWWPVK